MIFSRRCFVAVFLAVSPVLLAASAKKQPARTMDNATAFKGAIVVDAATGNVLFEDRADTITPPASMTKLMTFAVLHDRMARGMVTLETPVKITNEDAKEGGTQVFLDPRETFPVRELIYAMMIQSANDAAHALARVSAGSVEAFVELMNVKAKELGMKNTTFRSPHGLPPTSRKVTEGDLTTPRDYALLCRYLIQNTDVLKYTSVVSRLFGEGVRTQPMQMKNHNDLLGKVSGVDGLKTGFTDAAGYCLSATAQRNGRRVIVVIMGSLGPGGTRDYGRARNLKAMELLERGFAALPPAPETPAPATPTPAAKPAIPVIADAALKPAPTPTPPPSSGTSSNPPSPGTSTSEPITKLSLPKK